MIALPFAQPFGIENAIQCDVSGHEASRGYDGACERPAASLVHANDARATCRPVKPFVRIGTALDGRKAPFVPRRQCPGASTRASRFCRCR